MNGSSSMQYGRQPDNQQLQDEPGASDNRLTISPGDFGGIAKEWKDGEEYTVTMKIKQASPGEFEVLSMKESESPAEDAGETQEKPQPQGGEGKMSGGAGYANPAIQKMMGA